MQRCAAGCGGRGFSASHAGAQEPFHSCQQLLPGCHAALGTARVGTALSSRGAVKPCHTVYALCQASSANRGNPELLNWPQAVSLAIQVMPCILPTKQESPPGLLSAKQILLWEWWCPHGIVPEKEGNKPLLSHRHQYICSLSHFNIQRKCFCGG